MKEVQRWQPKENFVFEAIQYDPPINCKAVAEFLGEEYTCDNYLGTTLEHAQEKWYIESVNSPIVANPGDFIVKRSGIFYTIPKEVFLQRYVLIEDKD